MGSGTPYLDQGLGIPPMRSGLPRRSRPRSGVKLDLVNMYNCRVNDVSVGNEAPYRAIPKRGDKQFLVDFKVCFRCWRENVGITRSITWLLMPWILSRADWTIGAYPGLTRSTTMLLMTWPLASPGHQHPWHQCTVNLWYKSHLSRQKNCS